VTFRILNLYCGIGGNAKLWPDSVEVTGVDTNADVLRVYAHNRPDDIIVQADAHQFLLDNHQNYDAVWSSPPCPTHSRMAKATRHASSARKYVDMSLYQEIIFLEHHFKGKWFCVENVRPFYGEPLMPAQSVGRHIFWADFIIRAKEVPQPESFIILGTVGETEKLKEWLDIDYPEGMGAIYMPGNHCPGQCLRNACHPLMSLDIFNSAMDDSQQEMFG
jgi:DNA (cytosine-5)-methyltransferase 1